MSFAFKKEQLRKMLEGLEPSLERRKVGADTGERCEISTGTDSFRVTE